MGIFAATLNEEEFARRYETVEEAVAEESSLADVFHTLRHTRKKLGRTFCKCQQHRGHLLCDQPPSLGQTDVRGMLMTIRQVRLYSADMAKLPEGEEFDWHTKYDDSYTPGTFPRYYPHGYYVDDLPDVTHIGTVGDWFPDPMAKENLCEGRTHHR